ncbi:MAG TPA: HAMP domain-containing sensor histidine kinase [Vicinamibacterales bacterium]|nr:HAMP domain-containing sensor histidine kinase [Vicinamibacterales bacterium]
MSEAPQTPRPTRVWYRSLYWRIALGLTAFLALMLLAQGLLFIWVTDRIAGSMPARSPRRLAVLVASDVSAALDREPRLDLSAYVREQYGHVFRPLIVVMRDGPVVSNHGTAIPPEAEARLRLQLGRMSRARPQRFERLRGPRGGEMAAIVVNGDVVGAVAVPPGGPPFPLLLRELGPTMGAIGGAVLAAGGVAIALVVFGPARRRLRQLQAATERIGAGDLSARAPADGGDEVAELAGSFNRMAAELDARARALEASDRARRQLLADVSHELMTPLTAMRGYVETLRMTDVPLDQRTRERYLGIIEDETKRMERIIGDLLDLARLEGGGAALRREPVGVAALFERVAMRHERELQERGITLARRVDPGAEIVVGDADRLEQALQNLAANALRHTPDGGRIELSAEHRPDGVRLTVRDNGPGIPPAHLPLIFDRFYKADASRRAGPGAGSGLGLSIVKAIVEQHGGTVAARNDRGAVFELVLPSGQGA